MDPMRHRRESGPGEHRNLALAAAVLLSGLAGCASPGPPRPPSLHLPRPVSDLTAVRIGDTVQLRFTAPSQSTDKLALHGSIPGEFCRQLPDQSCIPVPASKVSIPVGSSSSSKGSASSKGGGGSGTASNQITWTDRLPAKLTSGAAELLTYRVEFFSPAQRSAGLSNPAYTAAGAAPAPVTGLRAQGSRLGIVLRWNPEPGPPGGSSSSSAEVVLRREDLSPKKPHAQAKDQTAPKGSPPEWVWLRTNSSAESGVEGSDRTLDASVVPDTMYRYTGERRVTLHLSLTDGKPKDRTSGTQTILLRSAPSTPVVFTLLQIFPPPAPTALTAAAYFNPTPSGTPSGFAVDLIWQPIDATGLMTPLAGYNLYRQPLDAALQPTAPYRQLNTTPLRTPAFHDAGADPATRYRYAVTAIDSKGNESRLDTTLLEPSSR